MGSGAAAVPGKFSPPRPAGRARTAAGRAGPHPGGLGAPGGGRSQARLPPGGRQRSPPRPWAPAVAQLPRRAEVGGGDCGRGGRKRGRGQVIICNNTSGGGGSGGERGGSGGGRRRRGGGGGAGGGTGAVAVPGPPRRSRPLRPRRRPLPPAGPFRAPRRCPAASPGQPPRPPGSPLRHRPPGSPPPAGPRQPLPRPSASPPAPPPGPPSTSLVPPPPRAPPLVLTVPRMEEGGGGRQPRARRDAPETKSESGGRCLPPRRAAALCPGLTSRAQIPAFPCRQICPCKGWGRGWGRGGRTVGGRQLPVPRGGGGDNGAGGSPDPASITFLPCPAGWQAQKCAPWLAAKPRSFVQGSLCFYGVFLVLFQPTFSSVLPQPGRVERWREVKDARSYKGTQRFKTKPVEHIKERGKGNCDHFLFVLRLFIRIAIKIIRGLSVTGFVMECYPLSSRWVPAFALKRRGRQKGYAALRLWRGGLPSLTHLEGDFWMSS